MNCNGRHHTNCNCRPQSSLTKSLQDSRPPFTQPRSTGPRLSGFAHLDTHKIGCPHDKAPPPPVWRCLRGCLPTLRPQLIHTSSPHNPTCNGLPNGLILCPLDDVTTICCVITASCPLFALVRPLSWPAAGDPEIPPQTLRRRCHRRRMNRPDSAVSRPVEAPGPSSPGMPNPKM